MAGNVNCGQMRPMDWEDRVPVMHAKIRVGGQEKNGRGRGPMVEGGPVAMQLECNAKKYRGCGRCSVALENQQTSRCRFPKCWIRLGEKAANPSCKRGEQRGHAVGRQMRGVVF